MQKFAKMCLPQDIWLYVLSAAIGGLISFLVTKLLNSSQNNAKRRQKIMPHYKAYQFDIVIKLTFPGRIICSVQTGLLDSIQLLIMH